MSMNEEKEIYELGYYLDRGMNVESSYFCIYLMVGKKGFIFKSRYKSRYEFINKAPSPSKFLGKEFYDVILTNMLDVFSLGLPTIISSSTRIQHLSSICNPTYYPDLIESYEWISALLSRYTELYVEEFKDTLNYYPLENLINAFKECIEDLENKLL